jgi:cytochrome o ubiquinol oxidase subunit 2
MLFMTIERFKDRDAKAVYRHFREHGRMLPDGLTFAGSWVEASFERCFPPVTFHITSASVMTAFFIPQLGSMIYAMNGMETRLNLAADTPGQYRGMASHYSGAGFPGMHFVVDAVPAERFAGWVAETRQAEKALDAAAYAELGRQSSDVAPFVYGRVDPALFAGIVSRRIPAAVPGQAEAAR